MLLAIDIGNTNINFGILDGIKVVKKFSVSTRGYNIRAVNKLLAGEDIDGIILCSVVPVITKAVVRDFKKALGRRIYIVGKDIGIPIKNLYRYPKQVGQDRLVNAYAASVLYGAPLIAVDFGTAITFDVVSKGKEYLGGMILPGLSLSLGALAEHTALLPKIELSRPKEFIGRDTKNSMLSGIIYGFAALTDELVLRIKKIIGKRSYTIATGGDAGLIGRQLRQVDRIDNDLTLKGLGFIYQRQKGG